MFSLSNVVIQAAINSFGSDAVAGVSAALNFEFFTYYIVSGFAQAAVTFTSQNYAVRNFARCREIFRLSQIAAIGFTAILSGVFIFFRYPLLHIFTVDAGVMDYALIRLLIVTTLEFMTSLYEIPGSCLRGMGVSLLPASLRQLSVQGVVWRPLRRSSIRAGLAVAHRRGPVSQMVLNFAQVAQAMARVTR